MDLFVLSDYFKFPINQDYVNSLEDKKRHMLALYSKALTEKLDKWEEPVANKLILKRLLRKMDLRIDTSGLSLMSEGDAFEIWGNDFSFMAACNTFLQLTSWTFNDLLNKPWPELFMRETRFVDQALDSLGKLAESKKIVINPWEDHLVTERKNNPVQVILRGKALIPAFDSEGEFVAVVTIIKFITPN